MARRYCKNTVSGKQGRGRKYPAAVRAEVVMAMIGSNSICAVARKYGVPESTIRSWMAEEAKKPDGVFAAARAEAAREIAARAALGAKAQVGYLQRRVAENQRAAEIRAKLEKRLDEDARARKYEIGELLKSEEENLQDAAETGLVVRSAPGTYDRQLSDEERSELEKQLRPDNLHVTENISIVAAVGRKMAFRPGISGKIFAALGESGINIRMINQGPDELNIIFGVDNKDFKEAIRVLYSSFITK